MHPRYPNVFRSVRLGPVEIRNRFYASPQSMPMNILGKPTDDFVQYNVARAEGGCGLVFVSMAAHPRGRTIQPCIHPKENIPAFRVLADAVHEAGAKIFAEPYYHWQTAAPWQTLAPASPALGPSVAQFNYMERRSATRAMSRREIQGVTDSLRQTTAHLREAGFDGVMAHAAHGALLEQFLSPYFNRRTDEYGGSLENRMRLLVETLEAVREAAGESMAVGVRLNCNELLSGGYEEGEARAVLRALAASGLVHFVDLDVAMEPDQFWIGMPSQFIEPHPYRRYVAAVREAAGEMPVLSVLGRLTSMADAEQAIASGLCDMTGAARTLVAEPDFVRNAFEGREALSRTCISCNWCMASVAEGAQVCTINPATYRERIWRRVPPAPSAGKVVVVGGGPAGLEAARVSALRGHRVVLMEACGSLGGALSLWASLPGREIYQSSVDWWGRELARLGVEVRLGVAAGAEAVLAEAPGAVLLATGARYSADGVSNYRDFAIPGCDRAFVHRPEDILEGRVRPHGKVVILDAESLHAGVGVAELLARQGAQVELLTPYATPISPRLVGTQEAPLLLKRLRAAGVTLSGFSYIDAIADREVIVCDVHSDASRRIEGVEAVVLCTGRVPVNVLEAELDGKVAQLFVIGDALAVRTWAAAAFEGHKFARLVGEPGAPASIAEALFASDDPDHTPLPADIGRAARTPAPA